MRSHPGPIAFHVALVAALGIGAVFDEAIGRILQALGASMAVVGSLVVLSGGFERSPAIPVWAVEIYPLFICMVIAGYGFVVGTEARSCQPGSS